MNPIPIISRLTISRKQKPSFVDERTFEGTYNLINTAIIASSQRMGKLVDFKGNQIDHEKSQKRANVVNEILDRCPNYGNLLAVRNRHNVLYVSHMNVHDVKWVKEPDSVVSPDVMINGYPRQKQTQWQYPDLNKVIHFIPVLTYEWPWESRTSVLRPSQPKNIGIIHDVYEKIGIKSVQANCQYEHGQPWDLKFKNESKFDAVVFLNVPSHQERDFTLDDVKEKFKGYVTEDCEYIDLWNGETEGRFVGSRASSLNSTMTSISNFMSEESGVDTETLLEEERFFRKHVHIYKNI
jgi:hypothetical protein